MKKTEKFIVLRDKQTGDYIQKYKNVEAEYTLKTLDGEEPKDLTDEIESAKRKHYENLLRGLLGGNEED